jgi:thiol-disulfide isomerase/thioredoxin
MLDRIGLGAETISVVRNGQTKLLHRFPANQPLLKEGLRFLQREGDFAAYEKDAVAPSITLPDASGTTHTVHYGSKWVLVHIWSTWCPPCWADIDALNEFANPAPESLTVVAVAVNDTNQSLERFTKEHPLQFVNLMGGEWESKFANDFNVVSVPADVLVDADGHVLFVGVGAGSFRSVVELVKGYSLL